MAKYHDRHYVHEGLVHFHILKAMDWGHWAAQRGCGLGDTTLRRIEKKKPEHWAEAKAEADALLDRFAGARAAPAQRKMIAEALSAALTAARIVPVADETPA